MGLERCKADATLADIIDKKRKDGEEAASTSSESKAAKRAEGGADAGTEMAIQEWRILLEDLAKLDRAFHARFSGGERLKTKMSDLSQLINEINMIEKKRNNIFLT